MLSNGQIDVEIKSTIVTACSLTLVLSVNSDCRVHDRMRSWVLILKYPTLEPDWPAGPCTHGGSLDLGRVQVVGC